MKRITLTFMILLSVFFTIWGVKMKHPINRPENVKEDTETPWYETKYQAPKADDEWTLDPEIPLNYIPVPGEDELYMVVDDSGNITNYRKRVKQADGSWVWQDVNPDIPDNYEKVDDHEGRSCNNRLTLVDYERLLDYLTERTYAGDGLQETNLTGLKFTLKGVDYEVLEHTKDKYRVLMLNRKAISK